jgi:Tfp pilus assembly protein PilX
MSKLKNQNSGQALLLVVLAVAVLTTIGLSIVSRSISDVTLTTREEESLRAFSAAEAGIEEALISGSPTGTLPEGATFNVSKSGFPDNTSRYVYPAELESGESAIIWLMNHDENNNLVTPSYKSPGISVCWGKSGTPGSDANTPAIEVEVLYESAGGWHIARAAYDPNTLRRSSNSFSAIDTGGCPGLEQGFAFRKTIDMGATGFNLPYTVDGALKLLRVRMIYNSDTTQTLGVTGQENFPSQGVKVDSLGVSVNLQGRWKCFLCIQKP